MLYPFTAPPKPLSAGASQAITTPVDWASAWKRMGAEGNDGLIRTETVPEYFPAPLELMARMP